MSTAKQSEPWDLKGWAGENSALADLVREQSATCLMVYREDPRRVDEDLATEIATAEGGYGRKQLFELVQNGADALLAEPGRIEIVLTAEHLYVGNGGSAFTAGGVHGLMAARLDNKRSDEIGRFGLGFKSVIAVTDAPQVFSRSVSFGFDRVAASERIREVVPGRSHYPILRIAEPLDPWANSADDPHLARLMTWASTVIRLPLRPSAELHDRLAEDMSSFPAEFLLFCPHVRELHLDDQVTDEQRTIRVTEGSAGIIQLEDRGAITQWRVLKRRHTPSTAAANDAGELARRDEILVQWAVPYQGRNRLGSFWAFFPTQAKTTLSGIINAPWKLSDDRQSLLEGAFNQELLTEVLPKLVASELANLSDPADPAAVLDLLPARGREIRSWADDVINAPIFKECAEQASVPDCTGQFHKPSDLRLHPKGLTAGILEEWLAAASVPTEWTHHDVDRTPERRSKVERLLPDSATASVTEWIETISLAGTVEASATAISLVAQIAREQPELAKEARASRVLLLEDGYLAPPKSGTVFVRSNTEETGFAFIDPRLADAPGVRDNLEDLGIRVLDRSGELRNALARPGAIEWSRVWELSRAVPTAMAEEIFRDCLADPISKSLRVRNASSQWIPIERALLGGPVVPLNGSRDAAFLIDPRFHGADEELLSRLGAVSKPISRTPSPGERWVTTYEEILKEDFIARADGSRPALDRLVVEGPRPPWPLEVLASLTDPSRAAMTEIALQLDLGGPWTVRHATNKSYGKRSYQGAATWWIRKHGRFETTYGPWPVNQAIAPAADLPKEVLPVPDTSDAIAKRLSLLGHPSELRPDSWARMLSLSEVWREASRRYLLYAWAVHHVDPPGTLMIGDGDRARRLRPSEVAVSSDEDEYRSLVEQQISVILVAKLTDKQALMERWDLADGSRMLQQEFVVDPSGAPEALVDRFPGLRLLLEPTQLNLEIQPCQALQVVTATPGGQVTRNIPGMLRGGQVLVTADDPRAILQQVSNALRLDLSAMDIDRLLVRQQRDEARALEARIRQADSLAERLLTAVGIEALRRSVPRPALEAIEMDRTQPLDGVELAEISRAVHGLSILQFFKSDLEQRGLNPPQQWAGRAAARRFVADLGFPAEYAGFAGDRRPPILEVDGPAPLPPLHDYQEFVTTKIKDLVRGKGPARGMLALPTGAGKTRVAVEALVDEVRSGGLNGPVVWIAQSDELCEQAVQTWSYVWRGVGPAGRLIVSRFWAQNDLVEEPESFQLVVATPDKLRTVVDTAEFAWLTETSIVIVDEAHSSIAPEYTRVLEWLGRGRSRKDSRRLIGLTATPFRNVNVEETSRLAARYDHNRLDLGAFDTDPYVALQARGVLAQVRQEILQGVDIHLTQADEHEINRMFHLPSSVESTLGGNVVRNRRIVESVATLPEDWTVLLFATTVENARSLAAQLTFQGISAVAISSMTEPAARRRYVDQFKSGEIRVITNYNVLSQGFDAPAVRAVYVTRPTFSTNLYQQMIGRGLRGPLNGGSEEVLIVNVRDNLNLFGDRLAFHHFDQLWSTGEDPGELA